MRLRRLGSRGPVTSPSDSGSVDTSTRANASSIPRIVPFAASVSRTAFSMIVVSTRSRSNADRLIAPRTDAIAVCCSSDSLVWLKRRTFSIAITACRANVSMSSISRGMKGLTVWRQSVNAPITSASRMSGTLRPLRRRTWSRVMPVRCRNSGRSESMTRVGSPEASGTCTVLAPRTALPVMVARSN